MLKNYLPILHVLKMCIKSTLSSKYSWKVLTPQSATVCVSSGVEKRYKPAWPRVPCNIPTQVPRRNVTSIQSSPTETKPEWQRWNPWPSHKLSLNFIRGRSTSNPPASKRNNSGTLVLPMDNSTSQLSYASLNAFFSLVASKDALSTIHNATYWVYAYSRKIRRRNSPSFLKRKETHLLVSATPTLNSSKLAPRAGMINQVKKAFVLKLPPSVQLVSNDKGIYDYLWLLGATATSSWELKKLRTDVLWDAFGFRMLCKLSSTRRSTVGRNSRKHNFCCTARSNLPGTCARSTVPFFWRDLPTASTTHETSLDYNTH